jgi:CheY-like chemotaxis protein
MQAQLQNSRNKNVILLVDDEKPIIEVCTKMLNYLGYEVLEARDGQTAIEIFKENINAIDVVMLDMRMPGMNGAMVYEHLIQIKPDVKVLLFSGYFENEQIRRILRNSNTDLIQKPIRLIHLSEKLKAFIDSNNSN